MFLGLDLVLYILGYFFLVNVTLSKMIVLYSQCRVNGGTNLSVVLYDVIFLLLPLHVWASCVGRQAIHLLVEKALFRQKLSTVRRRAEGSAA